MSSDPLKSYNSLTSEELKERLLVAETANIALASIVASIHEVAHLDTEMVMDISKNMCEMESEVEDATREFIDNVLAIARQFQGHALQ